MAYDINKTLTEYFPKDSNDDPAVKATPETIRDWIKKLVTEVWIDPRCGDGRCETPYEYHSFGRFGCKADWHAPSPQADPCAGLVHGAD